MAGTVIDDSEVVLDYLVDTAAKVRGTDPLPFTKPAIAKATRLNESDVSNAITKLEDDVETHLVYVKVHLPETRAGNRVYRRFVKAGLVSRSAFAAMFLVLTALYLLAFNYPLRWITEGAPGEAQAYRDGATTALLWATIGGLPAAMLLRRLLTGHLHWKMRSEATYNRVWQVSKVSVLSGAGLALAYVAIFSWIGEPVSGVAAAGFFLGGFPIAWGYWALVTRNET